MKKWLVLVIMAAVIFSVSGVGIGEKEKDTKKTAIEKKTPRPSGSKAEELRKQIRQGRGRQPANPKDRMKRFQQMQEAQLKRAQEGPMALIKELNAIKKLAEKEKSKKTVAALEKLIAKTQKKMDTTVKGIKDRQAKHQEMIKKRGKRPVSLEKTDAQPKKMNKRDKKNRGKKKPKPGALEGTKNTDKE
jgi:hypothetical protein